MATKWRVSIGVAAGVVILGMAAGLALWRYHEEPRFCSTCHIMDPYLESWQGSDLGAHDHGQEGVDCLDCHQATVQQQVHELVVYVRGDFTEPLQELRYSMAECFGCHEHGSYEQIIELTSNWEASVGANPHNSHFGEMECRLCHKMHRESVDYCAQCHAYGWEVP